MVDLIQLKTQFDLERDDKHWWFSGRMLACHAGDPGPIPGQCTFFLLSIEDLVKRML